MNHNEHTRDHYATLEISPSANAEEIRSAYKKLVAQYHPDRHQGNELETLAKEKLAEINEAYAVLSDPQKRRGYDEFIGQRQRSVPGRPSPSPEDPKGKAPAYLRPVMTLIAVALGGFLLRFMRNPRALAMVIGLVGVLWLSNVLVKKYHDD